MDSSDDHVKQLLRVHYSNELPLPWGRVYASDTSRTVRCTSLLKDDSLDLEKPLALAATSSAILHEPRQAVLGGRPIAHPLDRSAAHGCRVAFAISGADAAVALES